MSVEGNSQFVGRIEDAEGNKKVVVIADGAAFGAYVAKVTTIAKSRKDVMLYFPESFEWLIRTDLRLTWIILESSTTINLLVGTIIYDI